MNVPVRRVTWSRTVRIIRTIHPPIDLFEDIADPADWEALASAEAKFNPRIRESIGDLSKVPVARRVTGPGASWVMAPFVHCSPLRPGRFSDGSFGLYYAGDRTEVAIAETVHHHARFMSATEETPGWTSQFRELIGSIDTGAPCGWLERHHLAQRALSRGPVHRRLLARRDPDPDPRGAFRVPLGWGPRGLRQAPG